MWECPDFYRIPNTDAWVLKASTGGRDWWSVGKHQPRDEMCNRDYLSMK